MVERSGDGQRLSLSKVDRGHQLLHLGGADHPAVDSEHPVELGALPEPEHGRVGVAKVEPPHLAEEQVEAELPGEALVEPEALPEEGYALDG